MRILVIFFLFISSVSFGQENLQYAAKLDFHPTKFSMLNFQPFFNPQQSFCLSDTGCKGAEAASVKGKPYEAFFCKLEVKTEHFLGLGFQIHAGDYNEMFRKF